MPAPAYRSFVKAEVFTASNVGGNGNTVTLNKPSGVASGDVLIVAMNNIGASRSLVSTSSGWTLIKEQLVATAPAVGLWVFKKVAGGSEPSSYNFTFNYDFNGSAGIVAYSGGSDVSIVGNVTTTSGSTSPYSVVAPSITTPDNDSLLVWIGTLNVPTPTAAASFTPPSGYTERFEQSTSYNNAALSMADKDQATAGASGSATGSASNASGGTANALGLLVAIAPTGGASTIVASGSGEIPEIKAASLSPSLVETSAGNTALAIVRVTDQDGDPISSLSGSVTSSSTSIATASQVAATNDDGEASILINALAVGFSQIKATFDGIESNNITTSVIERVTRGSMSLAPAAPTVQVDRQVQFSGFVEGITTPAVGWSIVSGGGSITQSGLYTAPSTAGTARIRGTYLDDTTVAGEALVTIVVPATTDEATVTTIWRIAGNPYANSQLEYFIFSEKFELIASGSGLTNANGQLEVLISALYIGRKVQVIVNNLSQSLSTVGAVQGQQVVTAT
jgi:hypothetical protein